jgi:nucleoside 2-deoxyribosyltransferase
VLQQLAEERLVALRPASHAFEAELTGRGWRWLEQEIKQGSGQQAFIAMSFSPAMAPAEAALRAGVVAAGYNAVLVKDRDFTDGIVDKVYAEIRQSHFVVADFTENNNGAYLEAGYGLGLGLKVIGTCEARQLDPASKDRVHFDVRGMNIIGWRGENLADLTQRLTQRILALFPRGPVKPEQK